MNRKLVALAVCALFGTPALAQSNVTVYGIVDASYGYGKMGPNKAHHVRSGSTNGSRLGFRGTEDLGNGLKALFTLEYSLAIDGSAGIGTSRQSFVGLESTRLGFVGLGRQYAPGFFVTPYSAMGGAADLAVLMQLSSAAGATIRSGGQSRINNSINYKSPSFGGFRVNALYGLGETEERSNRRTNDVGSLGLSYASGPLAAGLIYQQKKGGAGVADQREWFAGAAYDLGVVKLMGSYQQVKDARNDGDTDAIYQIGGVIPVSDAGTVHVAWGRLDSDRGRDFDIDAWNLTYRHSLSRRTYVYAGYTHIDNGRNTNFSIVASRSADGLPLLGKDSQNLIVGLRHAF